MKRSFIYAISFPLAIVLVVGLGVPFAQATARSWNTNVSGNAAIAANWSPVGMPVAADDLTFNRTVGITVTFDTNVTSVNSHTYRGTHQVTLNITTPHNASSFFDIGPVSGDNAICVLDAGDLSCGGNITIGEVSGATGHFTISGSDASARTTGGTDDIICGFGGTGFLTLSGGALVESKDDIILGSLSTGAGTASVSGGTGVFPNAIVSTMKTTGSGGASNIIIGNNGDGTLNLASGGLADSIDDVQIATVSGATGNVTIGGTFSFFSSRLHADGNIDLARNASILSAGIGTITVNNGGSLDADGLLRIGDANGGTGTLNINGGGVFCGSLVCEQTGHAVLDFSDGTLNINGLGGTITPPSSVLVLDGAVAGDNPTLKFLGGAAGSLAGLSIGSSHQATCEIQTNSSLTSAGAPVLGFNAAGNGLLRVTGAGAAFNATASVLNVGNAGIGALDIQNAGHATTLFGQVASMPGSTGGVTIDDAGSQWHVTQDLYVGGAVLAAGGNGDVTISNGGNLQVDGVAKIWGPGKITVDGTGTLSSPLDVQAAGTLLLSNGGTVNADVDVVNGTITGAGTVNGEIFASSASSDIIANGVMHLGKSTSTLGFRNLGLVTVNGAGDLTLVDANTALAGDVVMNLGTLGSTHGLEISPGNALTGPGTLTGDIYMTGGTMSPGNAATPLTINGTLHNTTNNISGNKLHFGATGVYDGSGMCMADITSATTSIISPTGTLSIGRNTTTGFSYSGHLNVGGNIVTLLDSNGAVFNNGALTEINSGRIECPAGIGNSNGATIRGEGLFVGNVTNAGTLDPHSLNPADGGLMTIQGNFRNNPSGIVDIEIGDTPASGNNDRINVSGIAALGDPVLPPPASQIPTGGTLRVTLKNGFIPRVGQQFIAINATAGRTNNTFFTSIIAPSGGNAPCNNVTFVLVYSSTAAIVLIRPPLGCTALGDLNSDGGCNAADIPEFVGSLLGGPYNNCSDMNGDCKNDADDIQIFVNCLL